MGDQTNREIPAFGRQHLLQAQREHPTAMVLLLNLEGYYVYVSEACQRILGYAPQEMIGRHGNDFAADQDIDHVSAALRDALFNDVSVTINIRVKTKAEGLQPVRGAAFRLEDPGTGDIYFGAWVERLPQ